MIANDRKVDDGDTAICSPVCLTGKANHIIRGRVASQVSVVMSVHRRVEPRILQTAIDSVQLQTVTDYEFKIVVDGTVTPEQKRILDYASQSDSRIALLHNVHSMGIAFSLNRAIACSKGEYIARMDSDDVSLPQRLERQVAFLEQNRGIDLVGTCAYEVDNEQRILFKKQMPAISSELPAFLVKRNPFIHSTVVFRRKFFDKVGFYSSSFLRNEDTDLWCRAFAAGVIGANLQEFLYLFRVDQDFLDRRRGKMHAIEEASLRWNYIRKSGLPFYNLIFPFLTFSMRMSPKWALRLLYRFAR